MERKSYVDIERMKIKYNEMFSIGEQIVIQTKVDGSNASVSYDLETDSIVAFSRKKVLDETNTLNGFWEWTQHLNKSVLANLTDSGRYILFGEWLTKHKIRYPESAYNHFYLFDVYDRQLESYVSQEKVDWFYKELAFWGGKKYMPLRVPELYRGPFVSWEHCMSFMSMSTLGGQPVEEGIVIKTQDRLGERYNSSRPKYIKIVNEQFSEVQKSAKKPVNLEELKKRDEMKTYVAQYVTKRRIEKLLEKFVDEGELRADWDEHDMKWIAKNLPKAAYEDIKKEEPEVILAIENFGKVNAGIVMEIMREILKER